MTIWLVLHKPGQESKGTRLKMLDMSDNLGL